MTLQSVECSLHSEENRRDKVIAVLEDIAVSFIPVSISICQFS